jgi:hypothetical protein
VGEKAAEVGVHLSLHHIQQVGSRLILLIREHLQRDKASTSIASIRLVPSSGSPLLLTVRKEAAEVGVHLSLHHIRQVRSRLIHLIREHLQRDKYHHLVPHYC